MAMNVSSSHLEALLQLTAAGLDKEEDDEFISFHLNAVINAFTQSVLEGKLKNESIATLAVKCLINLTNSHERCLLFRRILDNSADSFLRSLCQLTLNRTCSLADLAAGLLCNLTRESHPLLEPVVSVIDLDELVAAICLMDKFNLQVSTDQLPQVLLNLSQSSHIRQKLCQEDNDLIGRLFTFTQVKYPTERRMAIAGLFKNCCFDDESHSRLLHHPEDFLSALTLPLCGPDDVLRDDEMEGLPDALQLTPGYPDTCREPELHIRILLCQALLQLCSTSAGRARIRDLRIYAILRELHKAEIDRPALLAIEHVVDVLIGDEPETPELSRLRTVEIPENIAKRVAASNESFLEDDDDEAVARPVPAIEGAGDGGD